MNRMDVYNFLHMVSSAGGTHANTACIGDRSWWSNGNGWNVGGTNSNPAWQEIDVDNLMEVDEEPILILLGKK